jgi:hypothetical protein
MKKTFLFPLGDHLVLRRFIKYSHFYIISTFGERLNESVHSSLRFSFAGDGGHHLLHFVFSLKKAYINNVDFILTRRDDTLPMKFYIREKDSFHRDTGRILEETTCYEEAQRRICELKTANPHAQVYVTIEYPKCKNLCSQIGNRH